MVVLLSLTMALIGWGQARALGFDRKLESAMMLSVMMINAGNYGLALNNFAFGAAGLQRAIIFYIGSSLINNTLGVFLASRGTASIGRSLLNTLLVPLPYATILGLVLNFGQFSLPLPVDRAVSLLGQAAVPTMLTILGLQLSRTSLRGKSKPLFLATTTRLVVAPVIAFGLVALLGMSGLTRQVSIVQSSMPTAVVTTIIATEFGSDPEFTSAVILISTLASVVSLSILLTLIM
jgi:predicted permease